MKHTHTHVHTHTHTHVHNAYMHAHTRICTHRHMCTHAHIYMHTHTHALVAWHFSRSGPCLQKCPPSAGVPPGSFPPLPAPFLPIGSPPSPPCLFTHIRGEGGSLCNRCKWPLPLGSGEGIFGGGEYLGKSESLRLPAPLGSPRRRLSLCTLASHC